MNKSLIFSALALLIASCASSPDGAGSGAAIQTDTRPAPLFAERKLASISIQGFDGKGVQTYRGSLVDYVDLARTFTDDLTRTLYEAGKLKVSLGEVVDSVSIHDSVEKRVGDFNVKRSELSSTVTYKASPFRKVDAVLSGRLTRFSSETPFEKSYVEIYFKVTDPYDGTVLWISRMRGTWKNVLATMAETLATGTYTEVGASGEGETAKADETPKEPVKKPAADPKKK